jgi:hypothetical protein
MLDVHPPHEKMHGFKDFLLHLLTITIGLLIALGLEGYAERWRQRELKNDADTKLRQEIRDEPYDTHQIRLGFAMGDLKSASWKTAAATGALGFMEYDQVQLYSAVYQLQDKYSALQDQTMDEFLQLQSYLIYGFDPTKITPVDAGSAELDTRRVLAHLVAMDQVGTALASEYNAVLRSH